MKIQKTLVDVDALNEGDMFEFDNFRDMIRFEKLCYQHCRRANKPRPVFNDSQLQVKKEIVYRLTVVGFKQIKNRANESNS
jgi:hypothetical protein